MPETKKSHQLQYICAFALLFLAMSVIASWAIQSHAIIQIFPTFIAIAPNTAFCFALVALILLSEESRYHTPIKIVFSSLIVSICLVSLLQDITGKYLGIDQLLFTPWFSDPSPFPGRMPASAALGFILSIIIINIIPYGHKKYLAGIIQLLTLIVFTIALFELMIYTLKLEFIFESYFLTRMAFHTECGFIILALGLWTSYRNSDWYAGFYNNYPERKIVIVIGLFFLFTSFMSCFGVVSVIAYKNVMAVDEILRNVLNEKKNIFDYIMKRGVIDVETTVTNPAFIDSLVHTNEVGKQILRQHMNYLVGRGFSALTISDSANHIIYQTGMRTNSEAMSFTLNYKYKPTLAWSDGFIFKITAPIFDRDKRKLLGYLNAEKKLEFFTQLYQQYQELKQTGEIVFCGPLSAGEFLCFPSRLNPKVFIVPQMINGFYTPMSFAMKGLQGSNNNYDYRKKLVIASYSPVGLSGLGMVVKMDANEVYMTLHDDLINSILIALTLALIGLLLLRWQIAPLVLKIINSKDEIITANKRLQESEERYELAINNSNTGLLEWQIGSPDMYISPQCKKLLGYQEDEIPNKVESFLNLLHPSDRARNNESLRRNIKYCEPYNIEYRLQSKSGEYKWYHSIGNSIRDSNGRVLRISGTLFDINERKKNDARAAMEYKLAKLLAESETLEICAQKLIQVLCAGFNWAYGTIWIVDNSNNKLLPIANSRLKSSKQIPKQNNPLLLTAEAGLPGMVWSSKSPIYANDISAFKNMPLKLQSHICSAFAFPIKWQENVLGIIEFFSAEKKEVNENSLRNSRIVSHQIAQFIQRIRVAAKLKEHENYLSAILESASDSIITFDYSGNVRSCNVQTIKLFNNSMANIINNNISNLIPELNEKKIGEIVNQKAVEFTLTQFTAPLTVEITISSMSLNENLLLVAIIRDISERKKTEILKNEFITTVSHELRTPITSILGSLSLLEGGVLGTLSTDALRMVKIANNNCNRLLSLINEILDVKKLEAGQLDFNIKKTDIVTLVQDAVLANQHYGNKKNIKIHFTDMIDPTFAAIDPDRMMQVMANLISNAVKFSHAGGDVKVKIKKINDNFVRIEVSDNGIGIPDEFKDKIFHKFSQARNSSAHKVSGAGLGLNITKAAVERMGGCINFKSELNMGSTFYIDLPILQETELI